MYKIESKKFISMHTRFVNVWYISHQPLKWREKSMINARRCSMHSLARFCSFISHHSFVHTCMRQKVYLWLFNGKMHLKGLFTAYQLFFIYIYTLRLTRKCTQQNLTTNISDLFDIFSFAFKILSKWLIAGLSICATETKFSVEAMKNAW